MTSLTDTRRRTALVAALLLLLGALAVLSTRTTPPVEAANGFPIYFDCTGGRALGDIKGSVQDKGFRGTTGVSSFTQGLVSPRDPASGLPTGKRQHKQIAFTMDADTSAVQLTQALIRSETFQTCRFRFVRRGPEGRKSQYLTVTLTNASVASQQLNGRKNGLDTYEFELTYQKINWRWNEGSSIEVEDDWEGQVS